MNDDIPFSTPELAADYFTIMGMFPLLLTGMIGDSPTLPPGIAIARLVRGKVMLTGLLCERQVMFDELASFLKPRGIHWRSEEDLWLWAEAHHWPQMAPGQGKISTNGPDECGSNPTPSTPIGPDVLRSAITECDRYQYEYCFALDQHIVAWDPSASLFQFPVIHDYLIHQQAIEMLACRQAAFSLNKSWLEPDANSSQSLDPARRHGIQCQLPRLDAFLRRVALWEDIRQQHS